MQFSKALLVAIFATANLAVAVPLDPAGVVAIREPGNRDGTFYEDKKRDNRHATFYEKREAGNRDGTFYEEDKRDNRHATFYEKREAGNRDGTFYEEDKREVDTNTLLSALFSPPELLATRG